MSQPHPRTLAFESVETLQGNSAPSRLGWTMARSFKLMPRIRWAAWTTCAALALAFLWQPVGVGAQFALGMAVIVAMTLIRRAGKGRFMRWTFLALGSFIVLRYFYWRRSQTLPDVDDIAGFTFGMLLALAELYCAFVLAISLTINADPLERGDAPCAADSQLADVDVFIPSYDEDRSILAMTVAAARSMDYP